MLVKPMKSHFIIATLFVVASLITKAQDSPNVTTPGTLTFTVKSITNNSTYSPKNVIAIWIKDGQGNFVVSRKVMAANRKQHLVKWNASSGGNSVSATTGATLTSHQTHTITWDGKNAAGIDVADGTYQIWVEYTSTNSASNGNAGPSLMVEFNKGAVSQHVAPANATYYQNIVADWVPLGVGTNDLNKAGASVNVFPNPMRDLLKIDLNLDKKSQVWISLFSINGEQLSIITEDILLSGMHTFDWNGKTDSGAKLPNGVYYLQISVNGYTEMRKIIINQ